MIGLKKNFFVAITLIVAACAVLFILSTGGPERKGEEKVPPLPDQAVERFSVSETEGGRPHWVLDADSAQILENEKRVMLTSPQVRFYEGGQYVSTLVAARGIINTESYDIAGEGSCVLTTAKGERLETSNLVYRSATKKVTTNDKVKLVRENEVIYGQGMEATPDLEKITIRKQRVELGGR